MKHRNSFAILAFSAAFLLAACGEQPAESSSIASSSSAVDPATTITVTFDTQGGSAVASQTIEKGAKATRPADPTREGYVFDDWYADSVCATLFDFDQVLNADTTVYAGWEDEPAESTESEPVGENYLFFKDTGWWNNAAAYTVAQFDDADPVRMTWIAFIKTGTRETGGDDGYNYWYIEVPEDALTVTFYRSWDDPTQGIEMDLNGPKTPVLTLAEATGNMYDITGVASYDWDAKPDVEGVWAVYDYNPSEDSSEGEDSSAVTPSGDYYGPEGSELVSWYLRGKGSLWEGGEDWTVGIQLYSNPNSTDLGCVLNITFAEGDTFKVTDGTSWYGYEKIDPYVSDMNKGLTNFVGDDDGVGGKNIKCSIAGTYDMYVNKDGVFWIQDHA